MKKIIIILITIIFASCTEEGLDRLPQGGLSPATFWKTEKDVWTAVNQIYASVLESEWEVTKENGTDNFTSHHHDWDASPWVYVPRNQVTTNNDFGYGFAWLRAMNYALEKIEEMEEGIVPVDLKERYIAEIRAMRAWNYTHLTMKFGDVPLITKVLSPEEAQETTRTPKDQVREFILNELTEAAQKLPVSYAGGYSKEKGRITKGASLSLKARAALYFRDYSVAEEAAKSVMALNIYSLHKIADLTDLQQQEVDMFSQFVDFDNLPDGISKEQFVNGIYSYRSIWYGEYASVDNPEYIHTAQFIPGNDKHYSTMPLQLIPRIIMKGEYGWASYGPTQKLINAYWTFDGKTKISDKGYSQRAADFRALKDLTNSPNDVEGANGDLLYSSGAVNTSTFLEEFSNRDARFYASIAFPFCPTVQFKEYGKDDNSVYEWDRGFNGRGITGYFCQKLYDPAMPKDPKNNRFGTVMGDFPLIRYAEILLTFAEARTQTSGYDGQVEAALNEIRDRIGMPVVPSGLSKIDALNFIHTERRIELAGEGHRFWDIRRYELEDSSLENAASKVQNETVFDCNNQNGVTWSWDPKLIYMPIPQSAIDFNSNLIQNTGY